MAFSLSSYALEKGHLVDQKSTITSFEPFSRDWSECSTLVESFSVKSGAATPGSRLDAPGPPSGFAREFESPAAGSSAPAMRVNRMSCARVFRFMRFLLLEKYACVRILQDNVLVRGGRGGLLRRANRPF